MIAAAAAGDWRAFRSLAQQEGWRVPEHELRLHRQGGCSSAWALRTDGRTLGLVTGVRHQKSAWLGNLIIAPAERGRGFGRTLFDFACRELRAGGAATLWLTASAAGAPLYRARGFHAVDTVERWVRQEGGRGERIAANRADTGARSDAEVWGEERTLLLHHLERAGSWLQAGESQALLQSGEDLQSIGPWYGSSSLADDRELLDSLLTAAAPQPEIVVDLLAASGRQSLLASAGFSCAGNTELMVSGPDEVQWSRLLGLATLGSCG